MKWNRFRAAVAFAAAALLAIALSSCATGGLTPNERIAADATSCLRVNGDCTVVQVKNDQWLDASVWINGFRRGTVLGFGSLPLFVPTSELTENGRCIAAFFRTIADHAVYFSTKECLTDRAGYFTLQLDPNRNVFLTPWLASQR